MAVKSYKDSLSILHLSNNYRPYLSGVANSLDQLHTQLLAMGHQSHIVTLDFLGQKNNEEHVTRLFSPIRFTYKKNPMAIPLLPYKSVKRIIEKDRPDIIHVHHPFLLGKVGLTLAQEYQIPVVFTYHTQYEKYVHYIPLPAIITQPIVLKLVHDFCKKVNGIIAPSKTIKNEIEKYSTVPIDIIASAIEQVFFSSISKKNCKKPMQLLSVSRFVKEKNIEFLLRIMNNLSLNYCLILVGYGVHEEFLRFYAFQKLRLSKDRIKFCCKPSKDELMKQYRNADLFIFASTSETQGLVLAEAMASGTPIIALDAPGSRDIIQHGKNGFLIKNEIEMHDAIVRCQNIEVYQQLSANAWKTAQEYKSQVLSQRMVDFYRKFL